MEKKIRFCVRVPSELKSTFKSSAVLAESILEVVVADSLRFYAGDTDEKLLDRRQRFLVALKMVKETKNQMPPKS